MNQTITHARYALILCALTFSNAHAAYFADPAANYGISMGASARARTVEAVDDNPAHLVVRTVGGALEDSSALDLLLDEEDGDNDGGLTSAPKKPLPSLGFFGANLNSDDPFGASESIYATPSACELYGVSEGMAGDPDEVFTNLEHYSIEADTQDQKRVARAIPTDITRPFWDVIKPDIDIRSARTRIDFTIPDKTKVGITPDGNCAITALCHGYSDNLPAGRFSYSTAIRCLLMRAILTAQLIAHSTNESSRYNSQSAVAITAAAMNGSIDEYKEYLNTDKNYVGPLAFTLFADRFQVPIYIFKEINGATRLLEVYGHEYVGQETLPLFLLHTGRENSAGTGGSAHYIYLRPLNRITAQSAGAVASAGRTSMPG